MDECQGLGGREINATDGIVIPIPIGTSLALYNNL